MECQLLQQVRESDAINRAGARVIPSYHPPPRPGCLWCCSHRSAVLGRVFLPLGMVQLCSLSQQREAVLTLSGWECSLSTQHGGMDVLLPQTNAALAGISSFQLIPLQPMDLGSVGSKGSCMGTAVSLARPLWSGCRSFSSSSMFPKGEKRILRLLSSAFKNIRHFSLKELV